MAIPTYLTIPLTVVDKPHMNNCILMATGLVDHFLMVELSYGLNI